MRTINVKPAKTATSENISRKRKQERNGIISDAGLLCAVISQPPLDTNMRKGLKSGKMVTVVSETSPGDERATDKESDLIADINVQTLWQTFRSNTTMHGLKYATGNSNYKLQGIIWVIALLCMGVMLIYTSVDLFCKYAQHTTMANIKVEMVDELPLPAITFCNLSPYKRSALNPDAVMDHYLLTISRMTDFVPPIDYSHPAYNALSRPLPDGWLHNVSFSVLDLFYACVNTENQRMNCNEVLVPTITDIGLCYTFNSHHQNGTYNPLTTSIIGSVKSFAFYIRVNQSEYVYSDNLAAGMKVIVHDPKETPDTNRGFFASPGFSVYASLYLTKYKYLPYPYPSTGGRYCLDTTAPGFQNPLNYHDMYSFYACIRECKYRYLVKLCGCQAPTDTGPARTCTFQEYAKCYRNASRGEYLHNITFQQTCNCDSPCEFNVYESSASNAYFPSQLNELFLMNAGFTNLRTDYLEVRFFFDTLSFLNVEYLPEYSIETIIATLGGQMGIFLGASLLTLSELVEFLLMAGLVACRRFMKRRQT